MFSRVHCGVSLVLFLSVLQQASSSDDGYNLDLEHDLGDGIFRHRGVLHFPTINGKDGEIISQITLNDSEINLLNNLNDDSEVYRVRVESRLSSYKKKNDDVKTNYVMGFTDLKTLVAAKLHDVISILTDEMGNVISIEVKPQRNEIEFEESETFTTILMVRGNSQELGPIPDTVGYLGKIQQEKMKKEIADKDPKSFFGKYWMYILPVVFLMMMSSANQQQGGGE